MVTEVVGRLRGRRTLEPAHVQGYHKEGQGKKDADYEGFRSEAIGQHDGQLTAADSPLFQVLHGDGEASSVPAASLGVLPRIIPRPCNR